MVVIPRAAARAISALLDQRVHPTFAGYLCVKQEAARQNRDKNLRPDFWGFHETFLRVPGGPAQRPYCRPFWNEYGATRERVWYQRNVAGTYAPSSAARIPALMEVIDITGRNYSLVDRHWEAAQKHLLYTKQLPVLQLAIFLYRDYAIEFADPRSLRTLIEVFRVEFGYPNGAGDAEFKHLYSMDGIDTNVNEYFEQI